VNADGSRWPGAFIAGKVLGGTSSINGMIYVRGQPEDYDGWADSGAPGWSWNEILPCFRSIEDHELGGSAVRGTGGPLHISLRQSSGAVFEAVIQAGITAGLPYCEDLNDRAGEGIGYFPVTIKNNRRVSAARAFLAPIIGRANLTVLTDTIVGKVVFDDLRATGVTCIANGSAREFRARKEILVCAGALQSPKILQVSGIGPAQHLRSLGVPVICDSPGVGANLLEHWGLRLHYRLLPSAYPKRGLTAVGLRVRALRRLIRRMGRLSYPGAAIGAFMRTSPDGRHADAELEIAPCSMTSAIGGSDWEPELTCQVLPLRSESHGRVMIRSSDPTALPEIRGDFLSTEYDRQLAADIVRHARRLFRQPALRAFLGEETFPGPQCHSNEEIVDVYRRSGSPGSHFAGTCKMGQDRMAVLDEKLRVRGVSGLRVVDGSIMPTLVSGNTNGPIMAIAWRAADLILGDG
jgi:choline dehydrogenase-like flavoprotein